MSVNIKFKTGNAAFDGDDKPYEIARILREIAAQIESGNTSGTARDANGNAVGSYKVD